MAIQVIITWETEEDAERVFPSDGSRGIRRIARDALNHYGIWSGDALMNDPPGTERLFVKDVLNQ